jgi:hypothetical protein
MKEPKPRIFMRHLGADRDRPVGGTIAHGYDLEGKSARLKVVAHLQDGITENLLFVIYWE